ncbi:hypothetical protein [uncultured Pontibacter sp.]|uniref:hypothetical protein n=1 Tax=uncultured Pontibacter sp. TaxID=453356 RepID=UPI00262926DE|nr:hypothetical protein [uncultured Pontibacter sp.]
MKDHPLLCRVQHVGNKKNDAGTRLHRFLRIFAAAAGLLKSQVQQHVEVYMASG